MFVLYRKYCNNKQTWSKGIVQNRIGRVLYLIKDCDSQLCFRKHINQLALYRGHRESRDAWDYDVNSNSEPPPPTLSRPHTPVSPPPLLPPSTPPTSPVSAPASSSSSSQEPTTSSVLTQAETQDPVHSSEEDEPPVPEVTQPASEDEEEFHEAVAEEELTVVKPRKLLRPRPKINFKQFF